MLLVMATMLCAVASAQLQLIPQQKLDSVANPRIVEGAKMQFSSGDKISFATIKEDAEPWEQSIEWRNGGDKTLVVTRVTTSCSCLQATAAKGAVKSGEEATLHLKYYPKGHPGKVEQRVFIYTNLSATMPSAIITVRGEVLPSADRRADYPFRRGVLLLRYEGLTFAGDKPQVERIACLNSGSRALKLSADEFSSQGLTLRSEPAVLQSGEEGDLVITYTPDEDKQPSWLKLYIKGLDEPLRAREIEVRIDKKNKN
jgi:hypothetical protein